MSKKFIGAAIVLALALTGCNFDLGQYPVGVPTPVIQLDLVTANLSATNVLSGGYTIKAYTIPGSPGGRLLTFITKGGAELPADGLYVQPCPAAGLGAKACDASVSTPITFTLPGATSDDFIITGVSVIGNNGISKVIPYSYKLPLNATQ